MEHDVVACAFVSLALCDSSSHFLIGIVRVGDRDPERGREAHGQESTLNVFGSPLVMGPTRASKHGDPCPRTVGGVGRDTNYGPSYRVEKQV